MAPTPTALIEIRKDVKTPRIVFRFQVVEYGKIRGYLDVLPEGIRWARHHGKKTAKHRRMLLTALDWDEVEKVARKQERVGKEKRREVEKWNRAHPSRTA